MKIIIIEDEKPAAEKLQKAIKKTDPAIQVIAILNSVRQSVQFLQQNGQPDLIFMDIELTDGLSFQIFDQLVITCPVIFTTAYDEYWQTAFEHNSIDYLLKPIRQDKLESALVKYKKLQQHFAKSYKEFFQQKDPGPVINGYRKRFLVKKGIELVAIRTEHIAYCYAAHKLSFLVDQQGQKFILDNSLNELENELDPVVFFRVSSKYLVNIHHIAKIQTIAKSKLSLELAPPAGEEILISQEAAAAFKKWMDR